MIIPKIGDKVRCIAEAMSSRDKKYNMFKLHNTYIVASVCRASSNASYVTTEEGYRMIYHIPNGCSADYCVECEIVTTEQDMFPIF
jgi:hypothetical protein